MSTAPLRQELEDLIRRDLLGPAGGEQETVTEQSVRNRYLLGMLAPLKLVEVDEEPFEELADGSDDNAEEGTAEPSTPAKRGVAPSTFGMSFCLDLAETAFEADAHWGQYLREPDADGKLVWKRYPRGSCRTIPLQEGNLRVWSPDAESPQAVVRGRVRRRAGHWSVTLFLSNEQEEGRPRDMYWLFQAELAVRGRFARSPGQGHVSTLDAVSRLEDQTNEMLYRRDVEFARGHGASVERELAEGRLDQAVRIRTVAMPRAVVRTVEQCEVPGLITDMQELAEAADGDLPGKLRPLTQAYAAWIADLEARRTGETDVLDYTDASAQVVERAREVLNRLEDGIALLAANADAREAFRFANRAMWQQRVRSVWIEARKAEPGRQLADVDITKNRSWRAFQLAFILINLPGLTSLDHPDRSASPYAGADLLWFPTGGGKTEAYLGLAAYTMAVRRLQKNAGGRDGENGVAVLMRYTLRLLTLQQFQRAATLICACEQIRLGDTPKWGETPFRLGLWVGRKTTPNRTAQSAEVVEALRSGRRPVFGVGSPHQFAACPWCGAAIDPGQHIVVEHYPAGRARTLIYCGDARGQCEYSRRKSPDEGLPLLVVDEEIYRQPPAMLIATVDKFAQMAWQGPVQTLFGQVTGWCPRHGFRSPELEDTNSHQAAGRFPAIATRPHALLRPPDLIIQDELHLISGPLGSLVGIYEGAVDQLATWAVDGKKVRPKVIASTATVRRAAAQVSALFNRQVRVFPPPGLEAGANFFSRELPVSDAAPGAGFVATVKKWSRFEDQWKAALKSEGIQIFHATDFASSQGEFKSWKGDRKRRGKFVSSLIGVIKKNTNKMLSVGVEIPAWDYVNQRYELEEVFQSPYALAGYAAVRLSSKWAKKKGHKVPVEVFFEDGDEGQSGLKALLKRHAVEPIFQSKQKIVAFQAADMVAWKQRIAMSNAMKLEKKMEADPDFETYNLLYREWQSLSGSAPNTGDFWVFSKERLIDNCVHNGVPKRNHPLILK